MFYYAIITLNGINFCFTLNHIVPMVSFLCMTSNNLLQQSLLHNLLLCSTALSLFLFLYFPKRNQRVIAKIFTFIALFSN